MKMNFKIGSNAANAARPAGLSFGVKTQPKAKASVKPTMATSVFQESLDHDDKMGHEFSKAKLPDLMKVHTRMVERQATEMLKEDPTVFQYDEVYEEECSQPLSQQLRTDALDQKKRVGLVMKNGAPEKGQSRYLTKIMAATDNRKVEQQIIEDKNLKKKREEEGNLFGDKEEFMTGAYKEELRKRKMFEDDMKKKDILDKMKEHKEGGFADFNRNLLNSGLARAGARREKAEQELASKFAAPGGYKIREDLPTIQQLPGSKIYGVAMKEEVGIKEEEYEAVEQVVKMEVKEEPDATDIEAENSMAAPSIVKKEKEDKGVKMEADIKMKEEPAESAVDAEEEDKGPKAPTAADILAAAGQRYADVYEVGSGRSQALFLRKQVEQKVKDAEFQHQAKKLKITNEQGRTEKPEQGPAQKPLSADEQKQIRENKSQSAKERYLARKKAAEQAS